MIYTVTGTNAHAVQAAIHERQQAFVATHGDMALERIDGQDAEYQQIYDALTALPFLASHKLVVLRAPSANKKFVESCEELLANIPETTDVLIYEPKLDKRSAFYKYLKKNTEYIEYTALDASGLARWLVAQSDGMLNMGDAHYLIDRVGTDQQLLSSELEKLLLSGQKITRDAINVLTDQTPQSTIFELLEAGFRGDKRRALRIYSEQRALKVEPQQIIAMLAWQLHVLALVKTAGSRSPDAIAKDAKMSPFVVKKSQAIARTISGNELKTLIANLLSIDTRSKRTMLDLDEALQHYLLTL